MIRRLLDYFLSIKLMNQVFLLNALMMFVTLLCVWILVSSTMLSNFTKNEIAYTSSAVVNLKDYFLEKEEFVYQTAREGLIKNMFPEGSGFEYFELHGGNATWSPDWMNRLQLTFIRYMEYRFASDNNLTAILFYSVDEDKCYPFSRMGSLISSVDEDTVLLMREHLEKPQLSVSLRPAVIESYSKTRSYSLLLNLRGIIGYKTLGSIKHDFSVQSISDYLKKYYEKAKGQFLITDADGRILYDSDAYLYEQRFEEPRLLQNADGFMTTGDGKYYVCMDKIRHLDVRIYGIIPREEIYGDFLPTARSLTVIYLALFLSFLIISYVASHKRGEQIAEITSTMRNTRQGNLSCRIPQTRSRNELHDIAQSFNETLDDLEQHIHQAYALELSNKQFQLMALQAQINPHFLYNTLEVIRMKALTTGSCEAAEMTYILSRLFRSSIKSGSLTTVAEEVDYCKDYLRLYEIRYQNNLSYRFRVDDPVKECAILRHMLQPLIENYIIHGFDAARDDNCIGITIHPEHDCILITVRDNGSGIPKEQLDTIQHNLEQGAAMPLESIGLINIHQRIKLVYGEKYGLSIQSDQSGTVVTVCVPRCTPEELLKRV